MTKAVSKKIGKTTASGSYESVGRLADGVVVLKPKSKPKHFTATEIKKTIVDIRRDATTGRFANASGHED